MDTLGQIIIEVLFWRQNVLPHCIVLSSEYPLSEVPLYTSYMTRCIPPSPPPSPPPQSRLTQQAHYHTYDVTLETKKEPLTVMVDGDTDSLVDNVIRSGANSNNVYAHSDSNDMTDKSLRLHPSPSPDWR